MKRQPFRTERIDRPCLVRGACANLIAGIVVAMACCGIADEPRSASVPSKQRSTEAATTLRYAEPRKLADLQNQEIVESSGLAASRRRDGILWTHNDSGDRPRIFAFDRMGQHWAQFDVRGATAIDWEDMASFEWKGQAWLLIGDVGDNSRKRRNVTVYLVEEPHDHTAVVRVERALSFRYEDGPCDCESLAWDPTTESVLLLAKSVLSSGVYLLPLFSEASDEDRIAKRIGRVALTSPTGLDVSPDGRRAVVLTYGHAYEYARGPDQSWPAAFAATPREIQMPFRRQGEAVCFGQDGETLYVTSEHLPAPLWEVPVQTAPPGP